MTNKRLVASAFFLTLGVSPTYAADNAQIVGVKVNAYGDKPEICFGLDQSLFFRREEILSGLRVEQEDKVLPIVARDISPVAGLFCIQNLQYDRSYTVTLSKIKDHENKVALDGGSFSVSIPTRTPSLSFAMPVCGKKCSLTEKEPLLEAINIQNAHLVVYRVEDQAVYSKAWRLIRPISVVPSESLTFAKEKGHESWQTDLAFGLAPHQVQSIKAPLPDLKNGLYFVSVTPQSGPSGIAADPKQVAGKWLTRSSFSLTTIGAADGLYAFVANEAGPVAGVRVSLINQNNEMVASEISKSDGTIRFNWPADLPKGDFLVLGTAEDGSVSFAEPALPPAQDVKTASIRLDQENYRAGAIVLVALDALPRPSDGFLRLLNPVGESVLEVPLAGSAPFLVPVSLPSDAAVGAWTLEWRQAKSNKPLANEIVNVQEPAASTKMIVMSDKKQLDADRALTLDIAMEGEAGAYRSGILSASVVRPSFSAWSEYVFGVEPAGEVEKKIASFMTDGHGKAHVTLSSLTMGEGAVRLAVQADGALTQNLIFPLKTSGQWVGVKRSPSARLGEAVFDFVALDGSSKKISANDLFFTIYQDARSFEWYQSEGTWAYRPLPQLHRVYAAPLSIFANSATTTRTSLPVGYYVFEISNTTGDVLTRGNFQMKAIEEGTETLKVSLDPKKKGNLLFQLDKPAVVAVVASDEKTRHVIHKRFPAGLQNLDVSSATARADQTVFVAALEGGASGYVRRKIDLPAYHAKAGASVDLSKAVSLTPSSKTLLPITLEGFGASAWSRGLFVSEDRQILKAADVALDKTGKMALFADLHTLNGGARFAAQAWNGEVSEVAFTDSMIEAPVVLDRLAPPMITAGSRVDRLLSIRNKNAPDGSYHYEIKSYDGVKFMGKTTGNVMLKKKQTTRVPLSFVANEAGLGVVQIELSGSDRFRYVEEIPFKILTDGKGPLFAGSVQKLDLNQAYQETAGSGRSFVARTPLVEAVRGLETALMQEGYSVAEQAAWLSLSSAGRDVILDSGYETASTLAQKQRRVLEALSHAQKSSGGFSVCAGCDGENIAATAAAVSALVSFGNDSVATSMQQRAITWLMRKLDNAWFDEKEQESRSNGLLALARVGKADVSTLRYFADLIRDKNVSSLTAARLALAFRLLGDEKASAEWVEKTLVDESKISAEIVTLLAENTLVDETIVAARGAALVGEASPYLMNAALSLAQRSESWFYSDVNGKHKAYGVLSLSEGQKAKGFVNSTPAPIYVVDLTRIASSLDPSVVTQHLFLQDGGLSDDNNPLEKNGVYVLELSGAYLASSSDLLVRVALSEGFEPLVSPLFTVEGVAQVYPWLGKDLSSVRALSIDDGVVTFLVKASVDGGQKWRVAFPMRAKKIGKFRFPFVEVRDLSGHAFGLTEGALALTVK